MGQASRFEQTMSRYGSRFDAIDVNNRSEEESNKVKKHIRELFPKIPEVDLQEIYERAWEQVSLFTPLSTSLYGRSSPGTAITELFAEYSVAPHPELLR